MARRGTRADDETWVVSIGPVGSAHAVTDERPKGRLIGHLIIPDVDERRGWREWYVYRDEEPGRRPPIGFRRPEDG